MCGYGPSTIYLKRFLDQKQIIVSFIFISVLMDQLQFIILQLFIYDVLVIYF